MTGDKKDKAWDGFCSYANEAVCWLIDLPISISDFSCFSKSATHDDSPSNFVSNPIDFSLIPKAKASASAFAIASFYFFYSAKLNSAFLPTIFFPYSLFFMVDFYTNY